MTMTVRRRKDTATPRVFLHKVADVRGGVSVATSELGGDFLPEGAVLSAADASGICHLVKVARVTAEVGASDTAIKVAKLHNFKVGDYVMAKTDDKAYAITKIDTSAKGYDTITVGTALGAIAVGGFLTEAKAEATGATGSKSEIKYLPQSVNGTGKPVVAGSNLDTDAWVIGVTKGNALPDFIASALKCIVNI